jgi:hypothetical protein
LLASCDCKNIFGTWPLPALTAAIFRPEMGIRLVMEVQVAIPELFGIEKVGGVNLNSIVCRLQGAVHRSLFLVVLG